MKGDILMSSGKVYIRGHKTRGKEVLAKLESFGGVNTWKWDLGDESAFFFLGENNEIDIAPERPNDYTEIFLDEPVAKEQDFEDEYEKYLEEHGNKSLNSNGTRIGSLTTEESEPTITREQVELKVVEYSVSVNWDFDKVYKRFINNYDIITAEEWRLLDCKNYDEKIKELFDKYKPTVVDFKPVHEGEWVTAGYKQSENKLSYELDWNFITQMAERMESNKGKYEPYNWKKPIDTQELRNAITRHAIEVAKGNFSDDGRPFGHLEALACNSMMLNFQLHNKK